MSAIRSIRVEKNIPNKSRPTILLKNVNQEKKIIIEENYNLILNLAKLNQIKFLSKQHEENEKSIVTTVDEIILMIPTDGLIDIEASISISPSVGIIKIISSTVVTIDFSFSSCCLDKNFI